MVPTTLPTYRSKQKLNNFTRPAAHKSKFTQVPTIFVYIYFDKLKIIFHLNLNIAIRIFFFFSFTFNAYIAC